MPTSDARWEETLADGERQLQETIRAHEERLGALRDDHGANLRRVEGERAEVLTRAEELRAFAATGMRWEASSRDAILAACNAVAIDGILATNVVFVPPAPDAAHFTAQLDHVLLTEYGCLVIESKRWDGVIFDGILPHRVHKSFGLLVDRSRDEDAPALAPPFAIQIAPSRSGALKVRIHCQGKAPAAQVRQQAIRLRQLVETQVGSTPYFSTCVFYSHPHAQLHANRRDVRASAATDIVGSDVELRQVILSLRKTNRSPLTSRGMTAIASLLSELGADVYGIGRYDSEWQSRFLAQQTRTAS